MAPRRSSIFNLFAGIVCIAIISTALASEGIDGVQTALLAEDLAIVQAGEEVYQTQCASCHGAQLEGQPNWRTRDASGLLPAPPHDASGHTWHHADDLLFEITKYGPGAVIGDDTYQSAMPAFEGILSDADIIAVLSYIKNSWPEEQRAWQDEVNGTQVDGIKTIKKKSTVLEKLFK